jgi:demethylmenaquinone methyltransferase/2-methoxy-6-polyprenyl-1,4-benzoquinol methylase
MFFQLCRFNYYVRFAVVKTQDIISYFDSKAESWDSMPHDPLLVNRILDMALNQNSKRVLDVACGTGVLFPFFLERGIEDITAIDFSNGMLAVARRKFNGEKHINLICSDATTYCFDGMFDSIIVYNAFPHFQDPQALLSNLVSHLERGGLLTIAHSAGRDELNRFHKEHSCPVSLALPAAEDVALMMGKHLSIKHVVSEEHLYLVSGEKS